MFRDKAILEALDSARRAAHVAITECQGRKQKLAAHAYRTIKTAIERAQAEVAAVIAIRDNGRADLSGGQR